MGWIIAAIAVFFLLKNGSLSSILPSQTVAGINNAGATLMPSIATASVPRASTSSCSGCSKGTTSAGEPLPVTPILSIPKGTPLIGPASPLAPQSQSSSFVHSAIGIEEMVN